MVGPSYYTRLPLCDVNKHKRGQNNVLGMIKRLASLCKHSLSQKIGKICIEKNTELQDRGKAKKWMLREWKWIIVSGLSIHGIINCLTDSILFSGWLYYLKALGCFFIPCQELLII